MKAHRLNEAANPVLEISSSFGGVTFRSTAHHHAAPSQTMTQLLWPEKLAQLILVLCFTMMSTATQAMQIFVKTLTDNIITLDVEPVRRRMIWNIRGDFGAEVIGSSGSGYAALR